MTAILAKKLGMTQVFLEDGDALDAPVLQEELGHAELLGEDRGHR
jgi:ribosomal protein L3